MNTLTFGLLLSALFGAPQRPATLPPVEWSCAKPQWTNGPSVEDGEFHGTIEVDCKFKGNSGGGLPQLQKYLTEQTAQKAKTVHAGPKDETFEGLPSTYFDTTSSFTSGGMSADVRAESHIATDGKTRFITAFHSTDIMGDGAKLLRGIENRAVIEPSGTPNEYKVHSAASMVVQKPGLVPVGMFKKTVVKKIEQGLPDSEKEMLEQAGNNT